LHAKSSHAVTLRDATKIALGAAGPPDGLIAGTEMKVGAEDGRLSITLTDVKTRPIRLAYAVGSGKTGITFVSLLADGRLFELRQSYFPSSHRWYVTPGQESQPETHMGTIYNPQ